MVYWILPIKMSERTCRKVCKTSVWKKLWISTTMKRKTRRRSRKAVHRYNPVPLVRGAEALKPPVIGAAHAIANHFDALDMIYTDYQRDTQQLKSYMERQWNFVGRMAGTFSDMIICIEAKGQGIRLVLLPLCVNINWRYLCVPICPSQTSASQTQRWCRGVCDFVPLAVILNICFVNIHPIERQFSIVDVKSIRCSAIPYLVGCFTFSVCPMFQ